MENIPKIDSFIPFYLIRRYPREWQAHLERIADYLLHTDVWVKEDNGIKFLDVSGIWKKRRSHFRSTTLMKEINYVSSCWEECLNVPERIPADSVVDVNGKKTEIKTLGLQKGRPVPVIIQSIEPMESDSR